MYEIYICMLFKNKALNKPSITVTHGGNYTIFFCMIPLKEILYHNINFTESFVQNSFNKGKCNIFCINMPT